MHNKPNFLVAAMALALVGCSATGGGGNPMDALGGLASLGSGAASGSGGDNRVGAAMDLFKAATVSEAELKSASLQMRAAGDAKANVATGKNIRRTVADMDWAPGSVLFVGSSRLAQHRQIFLGTTAARVLRHLPVPMIILPQSAHPDSRQGATEEVPR